MKIKKIISLCKANKCISLYDMTTQMLTENTVGYLDELSSMSSIKYENLK